MAGIPVVIAANGRGLPVRQVTSGAPVMTVATNGFGIPIVLSTRGIPFVVQGAGATLNALSLDNTTPTQNQAVTINILGATVGSTITVQTGALPAGLTLNSAARTITGTPTGTGLSSFTLRETLAGASNTPRDTALGITPSALAFTANPSFYGSPIEGGTNAVNFGTVNGDYDTAEMQVTDAAGGGNVLMAWTQADATSSWVIASTLGKTLYLQSRVKIGGLVVATSGYSAGLGPMAVGEVLAFAAAFNNATQSVGVANAVQFSVTPLTTANSPQYTVNPNNNLPSTTWFKHGFGGTVYVSSGLPITASGAFDGKLDGRLSGNVSIGQGHIAIELEKDAPHRLYAGMTSTAAAQTANLRITDGAAAGTTILDVAPQTVDADKVLDVSGNLYNAGSAALSTAAWQAAGGGIYGGVGFDFTPHVQTTAASGGNPAKSTVYIGKNSGAAPNIGWIAITRLSGAGITIEPEGMKVVVDVTTSAALLTAVSAARAGTRIRLNGGFTGSTTVAPFNFTQNTNKRAPGIFIEVPPNQIFQITLANSSGIVFAGGKLIGDTVQGNTNADFATNCSVRLSDCSRIAVVGALLGQGAKGGYVLDSQDVLFKNLVDERARDDMFTTVANAGKTLNRFQIDNIYAREPVVRGEKLHYWVDGSQVTNGSFNTGASGYGTTNFGIDTAHHDFIQPNDDLGGTYDNIWYTNIDIEGGTQGLWRGGSAIVNQGKVYVANVRLRLSDPQMVNFGGSDVSIENVSAGLHPNYNIFSSVIFNVERLGGGRVRGRNCSIASGSGVVTSPSGVNIADTSGAWNGDAAVMPDPVNISFPAWLPAYNMPTFIPRTTPPEVVTAPYVYGNNGFAPATATAAPGVKLTIGWGEFAGRETRTGGFTNPPLFKWTDNLVDIPGATGQIYDSTGRASTHVIDGWIMEFNSYGNSGWIKAQNSVTMT